MGFTLNQHEQEKQIKRLQQKEDHDTTDYESLENLPEINSVELKGNKSLSDLGIQGVLTFDDVPTDNSNNPVKSNGIYDSEKDIYAVMGEMGAKNLIQYPYYETTKSQYNIDYTSDDDGVITATGTATGTANMYLTPMSDYAKTLPLKKGRYCVSMPNDKGVTLRVGTTDSSGTATNIGVIDGSTDFIFEVNDESLHYHFIIQTLSGSILGDGVTLKPMLRLASDTDNTYQPYAKTNKQLTDAITAITPHILPDAPTTDGSYNLKVTVTSGEAAYSWEAVTP